MFFSCSFFQDILFNLTAFVVGRDERDSREGRAGPEGDEGQDRARGSGVKYVRWGKTTCPSGAQMVYEGMVKINQLHIDQASYITYSEIFKLGKLGELPKSV